MAPVAKRPTGIEIAGPLERRNARGLEIEGLTSAVEMAAHVIVRARGTAAPSKVALRARNNDDARASSSPLTMLTLDPCVILSTTSGILWPKQSMLMNTGKAHAPPDLGSNCP